MMTSTRRFGLAAGLALSLFCAPTVASAFECPMPQASSRFVLQDTKQQQQISQLLASGDMENRLGEIVNDLRTRYPDASRLDLVNYLVGAYCPAVAAMPGVSDLDKTQKVDRFSESVFDLLAESTP